MKASTKRTILRIVHLIAVIPVLGYIYQPIAEAEQYQRFTQLVFIPLAILNGLRLGHHRCCVLGRVELLRRLWMGVAGTDRALCREEDLDDDPLAPFGSDCIV